jgi:3-aminobutyryl-CoA ammonia-lyase
MRIGKEMVHYSNDLLAAGDTVKIFGDVATELMVRQAGDGGLIASYERIDFKKPLYAADYIEVLGKVVELGNTSLKMECEMYRIGGSKNLESKYTSSANIDEDNPELVATCKLVGVVRKEKQRKSWK